MDTRTFPVLIYDPRKGDKIAQRLSLQGNPRETLLKAKQERLENCGTLQELAGII